MSQISSRFSLVPYSPLNPSNLPHHSTWFLYYPHFFVFSFFVYIHMSISLTQSEWRIYIYIHTYTDIQTYIHTYIYSYMFDGAFFVVERQKRCEPLCAGSSAHFKWPRKYCLVRYRFIITRNSEVIMFSPCVFACLCVCVVVYVCHDVCPDDLTMKDWCHTNNF